MTNMTRKVTQVDLLSPAYGEGENLGRLVDRISPLFEATDRDWDVRLLIIVNENDPDDTPQIADRLANEYEQIDIIHRNVPASYGGAVKAGFRAVEGDVVVPIMADLSDDIDAIPEFVSAINEGYDFVYASRFIEPDSLERYPPTKLLANRLFNSAAQFLFGLDTKDLSNGFSAYHRSVIDEIGVDNLRSESFDIMVELKLLAHIYGYSSTEVAVTWKGRDAGVSKFDVLEQGKRYGRLILRLWALAQKRRISA